MTQDALAKAQAKITRQAQEIARRVDPDAPKLDLFSRQTRGGGWVAFGNQRGLLDAGKA